MSSQGPAAIPLGGRAHSAKTLAHLTRAECVAALSKAPAEGSVTIRRQSLQALEQKPEDPPHAESRQASPIGLGGHLKPAARAWAST